MSEPKCPRCGCADLHYEAGVFWVCTDCHLKWWQGPASALAQPPKEVTTMEGATQEDLDMLEGWATQKKDKKYDLGKPMVGLMKKDFARALLAVAEITTYGVEKYNQPGSWRQVENARERYEDALGRHDLQVPVEDYCAESGKLHASHRAWNALATLELILTEIEESRK